MKNLKILAFGLALAAWPAPGSAAPALVLLRETPAPVPAEEAAALAGFLAGALGESGLPRPPVLDEPPLQRLPTEAEIEAAGEDDPPGPVSLGFAERLALARESAPDGALALVAVRLRAYAPRVGGSGGLMTRLPAGLGGGAPTRPERAYLLADIIVLDLPGGETRDSFRLAADSARRGPPDPDAPSALSGTFFEKYRGFPMERALLELGETFAARLRPALTPPAGDDD